MSGEISEIGTLDVLGMQFRVRRVPAGVIGPAMKGVCDTASGDIALMQGMPAGIERVVLLHELLHVAADNVSVPLSEARVQALAAALASCPQLRITVGRVRR